MDQNPLVLGKNLDAISIYGVPVKLVGIPLSVAGSFVQRITVTPKCWYWLFDKPTTYRGVAHYNKRSIPVHRLSYLIFNGELPAGKEIHHVCEIPNCVNPEHLQALTPEDHSKITGNMLRVKFRKDCCKYGHPRDTTEQHITKAGKRLCKLCRIATQERRKTRLPKKQQRTHCKRGHPWIAENWIIWKGRKQCGPCHEIHMAEFKERRALCSVPPEKRQGFCKHGHELTEDNRYIDKRGYSSCRECRATNWNKYYEIRKQQIAEFRSTL
jgi:hypothetical protein